MKEHNEIDALFESAFDGLTLTPDASVKENIDQAIASKKKRRRFLFILFPFFLGAVGFAATIYFYSFSEPSTRHKSRSLSGRTSQNENPKQIFNRFELNKNETRNYNETPSDQSRLITTAIKSNQSVKVDHKSKKNSKGNVRIAKSDFEAQSEPLNRGDIQANKVPEKTENKTLSNQDSVDLTEKRPDSIPIPSITISDSTANLLALTAKCGASSPQAEKWSLIVLTYWEGEKKRFTDFQNEPFIANKRETAVIHSSAFYGKIEINRRFGRHWEALTGLGFRSSNLVQYGYVDTIKMPQEGLGSVSPLPITIAPDTVHLKEIQSFRVNSVVLPLGFGYSFPLTQKIRIRLTAGAEFSYGQFARQTLHPTLSAPTLRPFGFSVWARPELYYSFGKMELVGFGTFNQTLLQQLRWDFEPRRNPAFGGGIGLRIQL